MIYIRFFVELFLQMSDFQVHDGYLYLYIERIIAKLSEDSNISLAVSFRKTVEEIPLLKVVQSQFFFMRKFKLPMRIKIDQSSGEIKPKKLSIRLIVTDSTSKPHNIAIFAVNICESFCPQKLTIDAYEMRSKMHEPPVITLSYGVYKESDPEPAEFVNFREPRVKVPEPPSHSDDPDSSSGKTQIPLKKSTRVRNLSIPNLLELAPVRSGITHGVMSPTQSRPENSDDEFNENIEDQMVMLATEDSNSSFSSMREAIIRNFYDIAKLPAGKPGFMIAKKIDSSESQINKEYIDSIIKTLKNIRVTCSQENTAILFFASMLCMIQCLNPQSKQPPIPKQGSPKKINQESMKYILEQLEKLALEAAEGAVSLISKALFSGIKESLQLNQFSALKPTEAADKINKGLQKYSAWYEKYLLNNALDRVDVKLANMMITEGSLNTFSAVVNANTVLTEFEDKIHFVFKRFRQSLLVVLAHEALLDNPADIKTLVPLISPSFAYFLLCSLKTDSLLPKELDYTKIENFAEILKCDLTTPKEKILFEAELEPLPREGNKFSFK